MLSALYQKRDAAHRFDHAERLASCAARWAAGQEIDHEQVAALAYLITVRDAVLQQMAVRTAVEACFVEQGWTPLRIHALLHALERLPDQPQSEEEKLVADADTLLGLGLLGLLRQVATTTAAGGSLAEALRAAHKQLGRRMHTAVAQHEARPARDDLRELIARLEKTLR